MKAKRSTLPAFVLLAAATGSPAPAAWGMEGRPLLRAAFTARELTILHAAGAAVSEANGNGGPNITSNMDHPGFGKPSGFLRFANRGGKNINYLFVWNEDTVIVAFKGATGENQRLFVESWLARGTVDYRGHKIVVPSALYQAYLAVRQELFTQLRTSRAVKWDGGPAAKRLVITGHSMGGILANFLAHDLLGSGYRVDAVVTFGTPHVATSSFKTRLEALAASRRAQLISVENVHDAKIRRWADVVGLPTTPRDYLNRIGSPVDYAFRNGEHDMNAYFAVTRARALSKAAPQSFPKVDGTVATVWPVIDPNNGSGIRIEYWPQPASGTWWKAIKVVDKYGRGHWIEVENGRFLKGTRQLLVSRSTFEDQVRVEFWKAKFLGVHSYVGAQDVIITPGGGNAIKVWW